jgi:hypothetical protein
MSLWQGLPRAARSTFRVHPLWQPAQFAPDDSIIFLVDAGGARM